MTNLKNLVDFLIIAISIGIYFLLNSLHCGTDTASGYGVSKKMKK